MFKGTFLGLAPEDQNMIDNGYAEVIDEFAKVVTERSFNVMLYPSFIYNRSALRRKEQGLIRTVNNILNPVRMFYLIFVTYYCTLVLL